MNFRELEKHLQGTRKTLAEGCKDLGINVEDVDSFNLSVSMCVSCLTWHKESSMVIDSYDDSLCIYCEEVLGV